MTVKSFKRLADKYGFTVVEGKNIDGLEYAVLQAINTDGEPTDWIRYIKTTDTVQLIGNTDHCNIWFYDTRKDFNPEKIINFVTDLNIVFKLGEGGFSIELLIDPEDWQAIADVYDAYEDNRYFCN